MSTLTVRERIQAIQRRLGVSADGLVGPITLTRLEAVLDACDAVPDASDAPEPHNLIVSKRSIGLIVDHEIGSAANYWRRLQHPVWPGGQSGVTVGIGYDLGYAAANQIEKTWRGLLTDADLAKLLTVAGLKGDDARRAVGRVKTVTVPLDAAERVFYTQTLPEYARRTRRTYPGIEDLPADAQGALLSLVYNRGTALSGGSRREMKAIRGLIPQRDLDGIAEELRAMKRIWRSAGLPGLLRRRDDEADLVAGADRDYDDAELVRL